MAETPVDIRRAGAGDIDALLWISTGLWREDAGTHDPEVMNTDWPREHGRASFEALVEDPDRVWVLPEHRGRGLDGLLVEEFLAWARGRGAPYAIVTAFTAFTANPTAIALYEKHGFGSHTVTLRATL